MNSKKILGMVGIIFAVGLVIILLLSSGLGGGTQVVPADEEQVRAYKKTAFKLGTDWEMAMVIDLYQMEDQKLKDLSSINNVFTQLNFCQIKEDVYERWEETDENGNTISDGWDLVETNYYTGASGIYDFLVVDVAEKNIEVIVQAINGKNRQNGDRRYEVVINPLNIEIKDVVNTYYPNLAPKVDEMQELYESHYFLELYKDVTIDDFESGFDTGTDPGYSGDIAFDSTLGGNASAWASSKVGCAYSQENRFGERSFDCSSLVYRAYKPYGVDISYGGSTTAAEIARGMDVRGCQIGYNELSPGDLIFYSTSTNKRYKNITHVSMYIGNGTIVHARNKAMGVRFDPVSYCINYIKVIARPSGLK